MAKAMSIFGMAVGAILALAFAADLAIGVPFGGANSLMDILFLLSGAILAYLGFNAFRTAA